MMVNLAAKHHVSTSGSNAMSAGTVPEFDYKRA